MSDKLLIWLCVAVLLLMCVIGSSIVISGLMCGFLTAMGFALLALKAKPVRRFARKHPLLVDVIGSVGGYFLFPPGVIAFISAGVVAVVLTLLISLDRLINGVPTHVPKPTITARMAKASLLDRVGHSS